MKYFVILSVVAVASAARLDNVYLPPNSRGSGGASAGLQAPYTAPGGQNNYGQSSQSGHAGKAGQAGQYNDASSQNQAEILRYENEINEDNYHYAFETSDGTKVEQEGRVLPGAQPDEGSLQVSGSYSYIGDDGETYSITYTADENGFKPEGAHLPTPPPIPEEILRSLQLTAGNGGQYDSKKSSYDADNGY